MFCNALIVELPNGEIRLSALVVHESTLNKEQQALLNKTGIDIQRTHDTQYCISTPANKVHIIVMKN